MLRWSQALWASLFVYLQLFMRGQRSILLNDFEVNATVKLVSERDDY